MITKNDWDAALDEWVAAERERLGGPPTPEEVVAYTRGELTGADAARVRALLVYYPELTSLLTEVPPSSAPVVPLKRHAYGRMLPIAAGLVIALLTVLLVQSRWELARMSREQLEPYVHQTRHELRPLRARGATPEPPSYELPAGEERYLLALTIWESRAYHDYRIEIVRTSPPEPKPVWTTTGIQPVGGTFELSVSRELLQAGSYRIDIYGRGDGEERRLESYRIHVAE